MPPIKTKVIIIGAGVTGQATALHLRQKGIDDFLLIASHQVTAVSTQAAGYVIGGQWDNFTRISHAYGGEFAREFWNFGVTAYSAFLDFCHLNNVPLSIGEKLRLVASDHEHTEVVKAVEQLSTAGFGVRLLDDFSAQGWSLPATMKVVQCETKQSAHVHMAEFFSCLGRLIDAPNRLMYDHVTSCTTLPDGVRVRTAQGKDIEGEVIVLANHLEIGALYPSLAPALVSVADQWGIVEVAGAVPPPFDVPGTLFSSNFGYNWGLVAGGQRLHIGGARFLRKWAGIEAKEAVVEEKIANYLQAFCAETLGVAKDKVRLVAPMTAALDCRPCDELPIVGPLFGEQRLLMATGYMGSGLAMGFAAGQCLAELIADGKSPTLPRKFWPERLRSLS